KRQMVADVPVGAFLSGGLDSSTIVAEMAGQGGGHVKTFAVGFGDLIDELPFAREVAQQYRTEHHELQATIDVADMLRRMDEMDCATHFDATCYLPGDILVKVDRAAMAHGLETRAPFLDAELADYVLSLPWQMRFGGTKLKHLLRRACGHLWPASIRERGKQG